MEETQTSFIPKKIESKSVSSGGMNFLSFVSLIIFISVVAATGGLYLYNGYLNKLIVQNAAVLEKQRGAFEADLIQTLSRLDLRINTAKEILNKHVAPSLIFKLIEDTVLQSVRFKDFTYTLTEAGTANIKMSGETNSYAGVVLQSQKFGDNKYIKEPIFSGLNTDSAGNVVFNFGSFVDSRYILYENRLNIGDVVANKIESSESLSTSTPIMDSILQPVDVEVPVSTSTVKLNTNLKK